MRRQKTVRVTLKDRETRMVCFESIRLHRSGKIVVNPTPGICFQDPGGPNDVEAGFARIAERRARLAGLLIERVFR